MTNRTQLSWRTLSTKTKKIRGIIYSKKCNLPPKTKDKLINAGTKVVSNSNVPIKVRGASE